jgi:hypothetical protein
VDKSYNRTQGSGYWVVRPLMKAIQMLVVIFLVALMPPAQASDFDQVPLDQIRADVGSTCSVRPAERTLSLVGNNGFRIERWVVETCNGPVRYDVIYYPPEFFPDREVAYEIRRISS